ncbi:MAG: sensor histidine kinase [Polyangiaceae bacterium]|nr:sensor histidine kinase [Polyangiaceae bacterium]MCW5790899.1 sensor histidine kinase [Polyangiaceae bacterium]
MGNDRLTRQELSWLLAQEARGAAQSLRHGVTALSVQPPSIQPSVNPAPSLPEVAILGAAPGGVETTLDALDDAIALLSDLQSTPSRRGRIDLAALLCDVAPEARISLHHLGLAPGAGTEVFGDEAALRRMLQVLVTQGQAQLAEAPELEIRRDGSEVRITVVLGPDAQALGSTEQRWLSRMATRHGGRLELDGGTQSLMLPADSSAEELGELRRELEQAQQLGEVYARELAAAFSAGDLPRTSASPAAPRQDLAPLVAMARTLARPLRELFTSLRHLSEAEPGGPLEGPVSTGYELIGELSRLAALDTSAGETQLDLSTVAAAAVEQAGARAARHAVKLELEAEGGPTLSSRGEPLTLLIRALLDHAIAATPAGGAVQLRVEASARRITVQDGGPAIPSASWAELASGAVDPASMGRPSGSWLLVASALAADLGASLTLEEGAAFELSLSWR